MSGRKVDRSDEDTIVATCQYCGTEFPAKKITAKWCTRSHAQLAYQARQRAGDVSPRPRGSTDVVTLVEAVPEAMPAPPMREDEWLRSLSTCRCRTPRPGSTYFGEMHCAACGLVVLEEERVA